MRRAAYALIALVGLTLLVAAPARAGDGDVHVITIDRDINPVSARYLIRQLDEAVEEGAAAVLVEINTPGGLLDATQDITTAMLGAQVPVIAYVTPPGTRAASAGVFVTMSAHVAAMAPSTRMGAATPVSSEGGDIPEDLRNKIIADTVEYARSLAEARGRNADWAESAVVDADVVGAEEAVELDVVDLIAPDRRALLEEIDGREVTLGDGSTVTLRTADAPAVEREMSPFEQLLMVLANPNVAVLLLSIGSIGIYFELANPGTFFPGITGAIALILGLFSLGSLPINYAGLALLLLGLTLLGAEIWVASGGILGIGGGIAFLLGSFILIDDTRAPLLEVSRPLILGITLVLVGFVVFALQAVMRARHRPAYIGGGDLVGREASVRGPDAVYIAGELWSARPASGEGSLTPGRRVRVVDREGLHLLVEELPETDPDVREADAGQPTEEGT
ncbi:MAG TPA: nodulation protein NfeD [Candidatus Limnocylindria bacterium]|nr:nodulation protein NfeD [Candidatus Limnocylindria bacterium]